MHNTRHAFTLLIFTFYTSAQTLPLIGCPDGYEAGVDTVSGIPYCYSCGPPKAAILGCPPHACTNTTCSYYKWLCGEFSGHIVSPYMGPCTDQPADPKIFRKRSTELYWRNPHECHTGGEFQEMTAQAYTTVESEIGKDVSDPCGFLLNNCPNGVRDQAVIYLMNGQGTVMVGDDFSGFATVAVRLTNLGRSCG